MREETTLDTPVVSLPARVERARQRIAYQSDPALTDALSEDELRAERELAERIRTYERDQRWKQIKSASAHADRLRDTTAELERAEMADIMLARKAIAAQRRESDPRARLASLYRHRTWSLRALAGVVIAGMLWSAVNVQHNIAPGGPGDPLYWASFGLEAMISVCLVIIMIGTSRVAEWGVMGNRTQVMSAEILLLTLTIALNTYPHLKAGELYDAAVHGVAPVMIGVALLIHNAASARYSTAIVRASAEIPQDDDAATSLSVAPAR
ncbi:hypothetical protein [Nocardia camponoti]|uniref:DUF2637 domain-containing protein n=1 Tax=Nocardia camponoti TaxID=1616106 RepID=A0A917QR52_9NOCA|nr:hypothetical protein [Nocardia camponoti]GGK64047.1 hypothetical protein GCM10011591_40450 [Nocardia camponoti]